MNFASAFYGDHEHFGFGETLPGTRFTGFYRSMRRLQVHQFSEPLAFKAREDSVCKKELVILTDNPFREVFRVDLLSRASTWNGKSITLNFFRKKSSLFRIPHVNPR
jgi:hypothetical protein